MPSELGRTSASICIGTITALLIFVWLTAIHPPIGVRLCTMAVQNARMK